MILFLKPVFFASNYGWTVRYRKSGKTLCYLFPKKGAFTVLIILGRKEAVKAMFMLDDFSPGVKHILMSTDQLHDGRWLWIRVLSVNDIDDIKSL